MHTQELRHFSNRDPQVRVKALQHCLNCVALGKAVGSNLLSLWFADGTNYPGQDSIRARKHRFIEGLEADFLAAHRPGGYEARVARQRTEKNGAPGTNRPEAY